MPTFSRHIKIYLKRSLNDSTFKAINTSVLFKVKMNHFWLALMGFGILNTKNQFSLTKIPHISNKFHEEVKKGQEWDLWCNIVLVWLDVSYVLIFPRIFQSSKLQQKDNLYCSSSRKKLKLIKKKVYHWSGHLKMKPLGLSELNSLVGGIMVNVYKNKVTNEDSNATDFSPDKY